MSAKRDARQPIFAWTRLVLTLATVAVLSAVAGCATTESDMPWNAPQSWEGSPFIPGMTGSY